MPRLLYFLPPLAFCFLGAAGLFVWFVAGTETQHLPDVGWFVLVRDQPAFSWRDILLSASVWLLIVGLGWTVAEFCHQLGDGGFEARLVATVLWGGFRVVLIACLLVLVLSLFQ